MQKRISSLLTSSSCAAFVFAVVLLVLPAHGRADTLSFNSPEVVGTINPGAPADPADVVTYINNMISLSLGGSDAFSGQTVTRSLNTFGSLPTASATGAVSGTGTTVNLGNAGTFTYLFAKYDGQNDESLVWDVTGETGIVSIPANGPLGHGLSGWIEFESGGTPPPVPEPSSLLLLATGALSFVGPIRRRLLK